MINETYITLLDKIGPWVFFNTRGITFIDGFYSLFGIQDLLLLILGILLYRQIKKTEKRIIKITEVFLYIVMFSYIFPDFTATFEAQRVLFFEQKNGDMIEGFNLLYVWGRYPTYWFFGILIALFDTLKATTRNALQQRI